MFGNNSGQNIFASPKTPTHASVSNASVLTSKLPVDKNEAPVSKPAFQRADNFNADKINAAFQNLFGSKTNESLMQTPSFYDNRHQIKAKPSGQFFQHEEAQGQPKN